MKAFSLQLLIPALATLCLTSALAGDDPICGTWRFWDQSVREMRPDGSSGLPGRPGDSRWSRLSPPGMNEPVYEINYGGGRAFDRLTLRGSGSQLWGMRGRKPFLTASRVAKDIASSPMSRAGVPASAQQQPAGRQTQPQPAATQNQRQMVFAPDWMPAPQDISREFAKSLAFYCRFAVGDAPPGKEPVPGAIIWNLQWLMPMMEAEARVPGKDYLLRDYDMRNPGFPHNSIHVRSLHGKFVDPQTRELFNVCNLICDAQKQLISVELVATNPKAVMWQQPSPVGIPPVNPSAPGTVGIREPYYDFIDVKGNASTTQRVHYQLSGAGPGVSVIQTILAKNPGKVLENVRWYLTAPFARKLLDMVNTIAPAAQKP